MTYWVSLAAQGTFDAWRDAARRAISHRIAPEEIDWHGCGGLFDTTPLPERPGVHATRVPQAFMNLAKSVIWHSASERLPLLYRALWRLDRGEGEPLSPADPLGRKLLLMQKSVDRDIHKMHAFVRFREAPVQASRRRFAAWFEPTHNTLEPGSFFFTRRFGDMDWVIATPRLTARFVGGALSFGPGGTKPDLPEDAAESLWATYFSNIFNPARIKLNAMRSEMPKKYWHNLPETRLIPQMLADAEARVQKMHEAGVSTPRLGAAPVSQRYRSAMPQPPKRIDTLEDAAKAAAQCRECRLCEKATQTVWGEGAADAALMMVGEQPGDREDIEGRTFAGPAGLLLRELLADAGMDARKLWLTNAVKHFKFSPRGKRRLHRNPDRGEIAHCRFWLGLELALIKPKLTVALGASAAFALTGDDRSMAERRGKVEPGIHGGPVLITWHPSYILRARDPATATIARRDLARDVANALALSRNVHEECAKSSKEQG
ncbi:UdgX family uracil-DNA binding protein [Ensifer sp. ENS09]|uniref:UdgX family uracil-DNA binding protein n=1 Tax=Ensifer sp. ENS09 TaxID=2769263 RepID=UPI0017868F50|nr:UdgX family uracil-DNA binding protein [Ensifer sp. ENS09]MBD9652881.1 UdgX family uracil-DNA binding protein [Ensifer sp. ENS09]